MGNKLGITCIFTAEVIDKNNEVVFSTGPFHNTVLDCGLLSLFNYSITDMTKYVNIGSSTDRVDTSQTGLINRLFSCNTVFNEQDYLYYSYYPVFKGRKRVVQFPIGTCTGDFTEIGLSRLANSEYFNRQRFKNSLDQLVLVKVKSDEGLRITYDLRIYPDPSTKVYPEVYKLNLKGATAGDITFSNGTTTKTLTHAQLTTVNDAKLNLETLLGISKLANYVLIDDNYYILCHPANTESVNLSIVSHTLTGGTGEPTLTIEQTFENVKKLSSFDFQDVTADQILVEPLNTCWALPISGMNLTTMKLSAVSGSQFSGWGQLSTELLNMPFKNLYPKVITQANTLPAPTFTTLIKSPIIGDSSWVKRCYYAPGSLGTGTQIVSGITFNNGNESYPGIFVSELQTPITVPPEEEFELNVLFSWGRKV